MGLTRQRPKLPFQRPHILEPNGILISIINERHLSLLLGHRRFLDFGTIPSTVRELGRYEVSWFRSEPGRHRPSSLVVQSQVFHQLLKRSNPWSQTNDGQ